MDLSSLEKLVITAKEEENKTTLLVKAKKELNTSKVWILRKYVAQILTLINQLKQK